MAPYAEDAELAVFRTDPFALHRLLYKERGIQQVALVPPDRKQPLLKELRRLNITEDFVYPDMDTVAHEISERIPQELSQSL